MLASAFKLVASGKFEGGDCFGNLRQVARSMTSQPLGTLGQALNCRLARGVGQLIIETSLSHK